MRNSSNFPIALSVSLVIHLSLIFSLSALGIIPKQAAFNEMEITYYSVKSKSALLEKRMPKEQIPKNLDDVRLAQPIILSSENKIPESGIPSPAAGPQELFLRAKDFLQKPFLPKTEFLVKDTIKLSPDLESESSNKLSQGPAYLTYSAYARECIRRILHRRLSLVQERGVVCVEYSILSDGSLSNIRIIEERTLASDTLKGIALDAINDAAPFPRPPRELSGKPTIHTTVIKFILPESK